MPALPWLRSLGTSDRVVAALLVLATLASRLPFTAATTAVDHDAAHFALALERFDLLHKQPHPPGYLLFLAPAALLHQAGLAPLTALTAISVAFSAVGVLATWRLGAAMFGAAAGLAAAVLLLSSPLYWSRGELPLAYTAECALQALLGWALWRATTAPGVALPRAGAALGLAAGVRQDLLLFVVPLGAWVAYRARWRGAGRAASLLVAAALVWAIPLVVLSGGPEAYLAASRLQAGSVSPHAGLANLRANTRVVVSALAWLGGAGWLVLPLWATRHGVRLLPRWRDDRLLFYAVWLLPPLLFFVAVFAKLDYLLSVAPGVAVLLGAALVARVPGAASRSLLVTVVATANAALFLLWPAGNEEALGRRDIVAGDRLVAGYRDEVESRFDPGDAALLIPADSPLDFRTAMLELPQFAVYVMDFEDRAPKEYMVAQGHTSTYPLPTGGAVVPVAETVQALVWLSDAAPDPSWAVPAEAHSTPEGVAYSVIPYPPGERALRLGPYLLVRRTP